MKIRQAQGLAQNGRRPIFILLIVIAGLFTIWPGGTGWAETGDRAALMLEIPDQVTVAGPNFGLSDLGALKGGQASDLEVIQKIDFGPAPQPGQVRRFTRNYLELILQQYRFSGLIQLRMGEQVEVKVAALCFKTVDFENAIMGLLPPPKPEFIRRWVELNNPPAEIWVSCDEWRLEAATTGRLPEIGPVLFRVVLTNERLQGSRERIFNISGRIHATAKVYRALQNIPRYGIIKPVDFEPIEQELVTGHEILGEVPPEHRSTQPLHQGDLLRADRIQPVPLVCKDEEIRVILKDEKLTIQLMGIAKADGWLGDEIMLMNPTSKKIFKGQVIGEDLVEVKLK
ncbi:MAG TPA: flagellar basal body P-ring formation chaperone FlgA [Bacillota bacterium]|nr:flagellar basal body P-ring formation chaperone FlgA [Bacillota bacterium]